MRVSKVGSLGSSAVWVWREFQSGRYAALAAERVDTLYHLVALADSERPEDALLGTMMAIMQNMLN